MPFSFFRTTYKTRSPCQVPLGKNGPARLDPSNRVATIVATEINEGSLNLQVNQPNNFILKWINKSRQFIN